MTHERSPIDLNTVPELARLAHEVRRTRQPRRLRQHGEDVAVLVPAPAVQPLSEAARAQAQAALTQAQAHRAAMRAAHGGQPLAPSWPLIRAERDHRSTERG